MHGLDNYLTMVRLRTKMMLGDEMNKYYALNYIGQINKSYREYIDKALIKEGVEGLAISDGNVIAALYSQGTGMTMKEIALKVHRTKSTISQLVDKLEKSGYVYKQKHHTDKRSTVVVLTEKGMMLKPIFSKISSDVIDRFFEGFSDEMIEELMKALEKIMNNLSE